MLSKNIKSLLFNQQVQNNIKIQLMILVERIMYLRCLNKSKYYFYVSKF